MIGGLGVASLLLLAKTPPPRLLLWLPILACILGMSAGGASAQWLPNGTPVCDTSGNTGFYMLPQAASDQQGGSIVCWRDRRDPLLSFNVLGQRIGANGEMLWGAQGLPICNEIRAQQFPRMVPDGKYGVFVAWEDDRAGTETYIYAQRVDSSGVGQWGTGGRRVSERGGLFIALSSGNAGDLFLAWSTVEAVVVQRLDSMGNRLWGDSGVVVTTQPGTVGSGEVGVASDDSGGAVVVWEEANVVWAQRIDNAGRTTWTANGVRLSDANYVSGGVGIVSTGEGRVVVIWSTSIVLSEPAPMHVQRLSREGQGLWGTFGLTLGPIGAGGSQRVAADREGNVFVGLGNRIQKVDTNGRVWWPYPGVAFTSRTTGIASSCHVADERGGVWNFWAQETTDTYFDIHAQYIDATGRARWGPTGRVLSRAPSFQDLPNAAPDGVGGVIVVWDDFRNGHSNVFAGKVDTAGVITGMQTEAPRPPEEMRLESNFPNPFNPQTTIRYTLRSGGLVRLAVYDVLGRKVAVLADGIHSPGEHTVVFDGSGLAAGVYVCRLTHEGNIAILKMLLIH